ncbi:hypothetical protein [Longibacter sp.]|uniref:hypothetical protein n=1 Tax=Longibacter sp. TaxID=2045415 RepID=UPI003EB8D713
MGQQQLILLVLATVIVGLATVVGIRAFSENSAKSNADALMQDAVRMASDIQAWVQKPAPFGGAGDGEDWTAATLADIGYPLTSGNYENLNGTFTLSGGLITGTHDADGDGTVDQEVQVRVCGLRDTDIIGAIMQVGAQSSGATAPACAATTP